MHNNCLVLFAEQSSPHLILETKHVKYDENMLLVDQINLTLYLNILILCGFYKLLLIIIVLKPIITIHVCVVDKVTLAFDIRYLTWLFLCS